MTCSSNRSVTMQELMPVLEECLARGQSITFDPQGTSMLPLLCAHRDRVTLSPVPEKLHRYDLPLYRRTDGSYILHRIIRTGSSYTCCGDNQVTPEPGIQRTQIIGLVTEIQRCGHTFSVSHPLYRLYCRLWCFSRPWRAFLRGPFSRAKHSLRLLLRL